MQVEQQHRASAAWDIGDILHTELFSSTSSNPNIHTSPSTSFSASSRESTPMSQHLPTPPQQAPCSSFPATSPQLGGSSSSGLSATDPASDNFFAFLDDADNTKGAHPTSLDPFSSPSLSMSMSGNGFDFGNAFDFSGMPMMMTSPMPGSGEASQDYSMNMDMMMNMGMGMGAGMGAMDMGIDPQLVDSPAPLVVMGEEEEDQEEGGDDEDPPQEEVEEEVAALVAYDEVVDEEARVVERSDNDDDTE
ncbi:hypothetical protein DFP72DRAFT_1069323 [Ephemerocybe angulata]|uniref:Uncharacterized protein n=1 Tax=Ephemerocybe angulata TaxID=980116 RepID=A0A8H6M332_9AGAR|nr:hypothetical protein DFP72DRAFT_1069323 [Tulosesus angulatus]